MWLTILVFQIGIWRSPAKDASKPILRSLNCMKLILLGYIRYVRGAALNSIITSIMAYVLVVEMSRIVIIVTILLNLVSCSFRNF